MTTTPVRVGALRYLAADWQTRLFGPDHKGATTDWFQQLRDADTTIRTELADTDVITPVRRPVAAIAAAPYREIHDPHLGLLRIAVSEPARIYEALAGVR